MRGSRKCFRGDLTVICVCRSDGGSEAYFWWFYNANLPVKKCKFSRKGGGLLDPPPLPLMILFSYIVHFISSEGIRGTKLRNISFQKTPINNNFDIISVGNYKSFNDILFDTCSLNILLYSSTIFLLTFQKLRINLYCKYLNKRNCQTTLHL